MLRYEDLVSQPMASILDIGSLLDVDPAGFRPAVFDVWRRGWHEAKPRLAPEDLEALAAAPIWSVAQAHGYLDEIW